MTRLPLSARPSSASSVSSLHPAGWIKLSRVTRLLSSSKAAGMKSLFLSLKASRWPSLSDPYPHLKGCTSFMRLCHKSPHLCLSGFPFYSPLRLKGWNFLFWLNQASASIEMFYGSIIPLNLLWSQQRQRNLGLYFSQFWSSCSFSIKSFTSVDSASSFSPHHVLPSC